MKNTKISATTLQSGDVIYFRKGDRFNGHFVLNGSGTSANPITVVYGFQDSDSLANLFAMIHLETKELR